MPLKIDPNVKSIIKKDLKNVSISCPYSAEKISEEEISPEHIIPAPNKYPYSKEELQARLNKIEKQIKQHPDDIELRKYFDALKKLI